MMGCPLGYTKDHAAQHDVDDSGLYNHLQNCLQEALGEFQVTSDDMLRFLSRPESNQAPVMVDTGPFPVEQEVRVALDPAASEALVMPCLLTTQWATSAAASGLDAFVGTDGAGAT